MWRDVVWLCVAVLAAVFTYEVVERRAWNTLTGRRPRAVILRGLAGTTLALAVALLVGAWVRLGWGYSEQDRVLIASGEDRPTATCMFINAFPADAELNGCLPAPGRPSILLWGDSHANHWRPAIEAAARTAGMGVGTLAMNGCRPLPGPVGGKHCPEFNKQVMQGFSSWRGSRNLRGIVLSGTWALGTGTHSPSIRGRAIERAGVFFDRRAGSAAAALAYLEEGLDVIARHAGDLGLRILIILPSPVQRYTPIRCLATGADGSCYVPIDVETAYTSPAVAVILRVARTHPNVRTIDPAGFMCENQRCGAVIKGLIAYTDEAHITRTFSEASAGQFKEALDWIVAGPAARMASRD
jgi:SGNH domain-containing protein